MPRVVEWSRWRLAVKLDPDKTIVPEILRRLVSSSLLDAIIIGGTQNITLQNTQKLIRQIIGAGYKGPLVQEVTTPGSISPAVDYYFIPIALNSGNLMWLRDAHLGVLNSLGTLIDWRYLAAEGYLILNPCSAAAKMTEAIMPLPEEISAYVAYAEMVLHLPILYIEYSGVLGDFELVKSISQSRQRIHLIYGGGISAGGQVQELLKLVDTVIIGNALYGDRSEVVLEEIFQC